MKRAIQYYSTVCVSLILLNHGIVLSWPSPVLPLLQSDASPLASGSISEEHAGWITSAIYFGSIIGSILSVIISESYGRKVAIYFTALSALISWIIILFASDFLMIFIARIFAGTAGGGAFTVVPPFITEISENEIRGILGTLSMIISNSGIVLGYFFGGYFEYYTIPYLAGTFPLLFMIGFSFIPETPEFLNNKNKINSAVKSLKFFRGYKNSSDDCSVAVMEEIELLNRKNDEKSSLPQLCLQDFTRRSSMHAIFIGTILTVIIHGSGTFFLLTYIETVFNESGIKISSNLASIIVGMMFLTGACFSTVLVDRTGRRPLIIGSCLSSTVCLSVTGIHFYLKSLEYDISNYSWIPLVSISGFFFNISWGVMSLYYVIANEIVPFKIRGVMSMSLRILLSVVGFLFIKYFYVMKNGLALHGCMFFFAINCLITALIMIFCLPETKSKPIDEIIAMLDKKGTKQKNEQIICEYEYVA